MTTSLHPTPGLRAGDRPRRHLAGLAAALLLAALPLPGQAQDNYPSRPVRLVVAQAAGGGPDLLARLVAQELGTQWKQPVIIENKAGAAGGIAAEYVAKSPADGYTLFVASAGIMTIAPAAEGKLPYAPEEFVPLVHLASLSNVFVVNASSPVKTVQALVEAARRAPGGLSTATMGPNSTGQISGEMLVRQSGIQLVEVAYKGESLGITDLRGGHLDLMAVGMPVALPHVRTGALTALAVTGSHRSPLLPEVPTMAESGFRNFDVTQWYALYAPASTPREVQSRIALAVRNVLDRPAVQKQILDMGMDPTNERQKDFPAFDKAEKRRWIDFMKGSAARPK